MLPPKDFYSSLINWVIDGYLHIFLTANNQTKKRKCINHESFRAFILRIDLRLVRLNFWRDAISSSFS